jgi:O-succinylbenzoic acid--CoA ligase
VGRLEDAGLRAGDVVAVVLPPGSDWLGIVSEVWQAGAALFPLDVRLPEPQSTALVRAAKPTVVLSREGWERIEGGVPADHDVALIVHTSGTGGRPKLVQFARSAVDAAVAASALALEASPRDPWLACLPLAHVGGLLVLLRAVLLGAPVIIHERFEAEAFAAERTTVFTSLVPTMLARLLDAEVDLQRYRAVLIGGARLPDEQAERARAAGAPVVETYGLTESFGGVIYDGRPLPGVEIRIDADGGIELHGPTLMLGYRFDVEATRRAFTDDGWLRPGDAGELDREGRLHVIGRFDDRINTGGEKVWPEEVEAVLRRHPKVREVGVGGRLDAEWGERVVAFVVPVDPTDPPTLDELRDAAARSLPRHRAPRELVLVDELPRTGSGKLRRVALGGGKE